MLHPRCRFTRIARTILSAYYGESARKKQRGKVSVINFLAECLELFVPIHGTILHTVV